MAKSDDDFFSEPSLEPAKLAAFIHGRDFWLIEAPADSSGEGTAPLVVELDDYPAIVAFTSEKELAQ